MFGKIFTQIFDSSLAEHPQTRWIFMDLLVLADQNGVVDMTHEAISRRTNVPLDLVKVAIGELELEDNRSRTPEFKGARLKRLDDHRNWGWMIVNYVKYRNIANAQSYREVTREKVAAIRARENPGSGKAEAVSEADVQAGELLHVITSNNRKAFKKPESNEIEFYASKIGLPSSEVGRFQDYYESNGWRVGRNPMKSWEAAMRNWKVNFEQRKYENGKGHPAQRVDRSVGTANEGIADQYKGLGRVARPKNV